VSDWLSNPAVRKLVVVLLVALGLAALGLLLRA
jgi:hypothetical protein